MLGINLEDDLDRIIDSLVVFEPHTAINLVDRFYGERHGRALVTGAIELFGVPVIGGDSTTIGLCAETDRLRRLLAGSGVDVVRGPDRGTLAHAFVASRDSADLVLPVISPTAQGYALAQLPSRTAAQIGTAARAAFRAAGCKDLARIDLRIIGENVYVAAIETVIDLSADGPLAAAIDPTELLIHLLEGDEFETLLTALHAVVAPTADAHSTQLPS